MSSEYSGSGFRVPGWALGMLPALVAACANVEAAPVATSASERPVQVRLAQVTDTSLVLPVTATGMLGAKQEVPLGFKIGGVVARIAVEEGQSVERGQVLATLEQPEIAGEVAKADAGLAQAERDQARAEALYTDSVIPRSAWEGAGTAVEVARANLGIARFNQQYAVITAPTSGTVLRRLAEPGQQISGGTAVLLLASAGRGQVMRVGLSDRDVARVAVNDVAEVQFDARAGERYTGRISQIGAQATPGSGTWEVEIRLDRRVSAPGGGVASGLIGRVAIHRLRADRVRLLPLGALLEGDADSGVVYTIVGGTARRHVVRVAFLTGDRVAVSDGLGDAESVVDAGAAYLHDGAQVSVEGGAR